MLQYARRFPSVTDCIQLTVTGDIERPVTLTDELRQLPRVEQVSDFHCVTTWSCRALRWSGYRFVDFYQQIVLPKAKPNASPAWVMFRGQDGYRASLPLEDLLAADVLLADSLNGQPLTIEHGAPLRLVAPAHYGYKSAKHVHQIALGADDRLHRSALTRWMVHPRAHVALEERGRGLPGWLLRFFYRPLVRPAIAHFRRALERYRQQSASVAD
jgi:DMSO/TMAO reductase YedYZ molybdopterin-dependent catalytic subunit